MNLKTIEALQERAHALAERIGVPFGANFADWKKEDEFTYEILGSGHIKFSNKANNAHIEFKDVRPGHVSQSQLSDPILSDNVVADVNASVIRNGSYTSDLSRSYSYEESESSHQDTDVGVDIGLQVRQTIGYGTSVTPVRGETELTASVNAHFNKKFGTSNSTSRSITNQIFVAPRKKVTITVTKSTSNFSQECQYWCDLDHSIHMDFGDQTYQFKWDSMDDLLRCLEGDGDFIKGDRLRWYSNNPLSQYPWLVDQVMESTELYFVTKNKFSNASSGKVEILEEDI